MVRSSVNLSTMGFIQILPDIIAPEQPPVSQL